MSQRVTTDTGADKGGGFSAAPYGSPERRFPARSRGTAQNRRQRRDASGFAPRGLRDRPLRNPVWRTASVPGPFGWSGGSAPGGAVGAITASMRPGGGDQIALVAKVRSRRMTEVTAGILVLLSFLGPRPRLRSRRSAPALLPALHADCTAHSRNPHTSYLGCRRGLDGLRGQLACRDRPGHDSAIREDRIRLCDPRCPDSGRK
jgi:hypothetical protein